jgi:hypothetical protein
MSKKFFMYFLLALFVLIIIGLLAVSFSAALYFLIGGIIAWSLIYIVAGLTQKYEIPLFKILIALLILCAIIVALFSLLYFMPHPSAQQSCPPGETITETEIKEYHAAIEPVDFSKGIFNLSEEVKYEVATSVCNETYAPTQIKIDENQTSISERQIHSSKRGIFIREIRFSPLNDTSFKHLENQPNTQSVTLNDFPRGSFYEARDTQTVEISPYLDTEIVRWDIRKLSDDVAFSYIDYPFYFLRTFLAPLIGISYQRHWVIAFLGMIFSVLVMPIIKPVLYDFGKNKFKSFFSNHPPKEEKKKATLIVSGKGEEKEISIDENTK